VGKTALHWAALEGHDNVVSHLLGKGADVDARDEVRIDVYLGSRYRLCLLCVIPLNFTQHNVDRTIG
jgi:ankyrin repeat protein